MPGIEEIISTFQSVDEQTRLQLLLDYSKRLPELPGELAAKANEDEGRVHECMSPVWLWVVPDNGRLRIHARVVEEAPTVRGMLGVLSAAYDGAPAEALRSIPMDLVSKLGLSGVIRMNRMVGLNAIIHRIRREAERAEAS